MLPRQILTTDKIVCKSMLGRRLVRHYSKDELMKTFSKSRIYIPGITFYGKETAMSLNPGKAKYGYKKDYITVVRGGYFGIEFSPIDKNGSSGHNLLVWQRKKIFNLNVQRLGTLISLPKEYNSNYSLEMNYSSSDPKTNVQEQKTLKIDKNSSTQGLVKFELNSFSDQNGTNMMIEIQHSEMVLIQRLAEYSLPFMLGWHALQGRSAVEEDLDEGFSKNDSRDDQ